MMHVRLMKDENGMTMIVVLGILFIMTALAFGAMFVAESDLLLSARDKESMEALHIAEAGLQKALWQLEQFGNAMEPRVFTLPVGSGSAEVNAAQDLTRGNWYWTVTSTGIAGEARRTIKVTVFNFSLWNMNMSLSNNSSLASGGNGIVGNTSVDGPFYIRGNVQLSGDSQITGGPFFEKSGTLIFSSNAAQLGTEANPIDAYIEPAEGQEDIITKHDKQVYTKSLSNQVPDITIPPLDLLIDYRERAAYESTETCSTYPGIISMQGQETGYKVLDNNTIISTGDPASRPTYVIDANRASFGLEVGEFAWDQLNKRLYVNGTVFVDGNLTLGQAANDEINYYGRGTIVVNGNITINGKLRPPYDAAKGAYDMNGNHVLGLVTDEIILINCSGNNSRDRNKPDVSGAFFASKKVQMTQNNTTFVGSMIAGQLAFADGTNNSHLFTHPSLPSFLPPSLPGSERFLAMTASWREVD